MLPKTITKKELSMLLDISQKKIDELVTQKILKKTNTGKFEVSAITDYVIYERTKLPDEIKLSDLADFLELSERRIQQFAENERIGRKF